MARPREGRRAPARRAAACARRPPQAAAKQRRSIDYTERRAAALERYTAENPPTWITSAASTGSSSWTVLWPAGFLWAPIAPAKKVRHRLLLPAFGPRVAKSAIFRTEGFPHQIDVKQLVWQTGDPSDLHFDGFHGRERPGHVVPERKVGANQTQRRVQIAGEPLGGPYLRDSVAVAGPSPRCATARGLEAAKSQRRPRAHGPWSRTRAPAWQTAPKPQARTTTTRSEARLHATFHATKGPESQWTGMLVNADRGHPNRT